MIKVLIIDDEPLAQALVKEYLQSYGNFEVAALCHNGFEGLKAINSLQPDLIFLDIQMPKITGFEMLELLENPPDIIFTTAYDEYALRAFEANAIDYLLKPFSKERFDKAVDKWLNNRQKSPGNEQNEAAAFPFTGRPEEKNRIVVKTKQGIKIIPVQEILYLEAFDDYVKIFTREGMFLKKRTLSYYEEVLPGNEFVRVHRSFILAVAQITRIESPAKESHSALLKSGMHIPLSRSGYQKLKNTLGL